MAKIVVDRVQARLEGDFVVFLIGMRINKPWKITKWWPTGMAMVRMLRELSKASPETGFLGYTLLGPMNLIQYWRSFERLEQYARNPDRTHWPAWVAFNRAMKNSRGDVGIWHETYRIRAGDYENIYSGMPPFGLARAAQAAALTAEQDSARQRLSP